MDIGGHLVKFFSTGRTDPKYPGTQFFTSTLDDFLREYIYFGYGARLAEIVVACRRLEEHFYLCFVSALETTPGLPPFHTKYMAFQFNQDIAEYGVYDFIALGFPYTRQHFIESVRPIYVRTLEGDERNGTGFLLENRKLVTARHCIENMKCVQIPGWDPSTTPLKNIWVNKDEKVDIAVLEFNDDPFPNIPGFRLEGAQILDDIMTMGYPPINGYFSVLIAETAQVAGYLQSTTGKIVGREQCYLDKQIHLLITARVKGGNSGGPIINCRGMVIGIVAQLPAGNDGVDTLGYGAAIPVTALEEILQGCCNQAGNIQCLPFTLGKDGFVTKN